MSDTESIKKQILESDDFVLNEVKKIQYGYRLKNVTRYIVDRQEKINTESVAEHIYALHLLADYFLPFEDPERKLDWQKIHNMLQYHDIDEIETGDKIGYLKTQADRDAEAKAAETVLNNFPKHLQTEIHKTNEEYNNQVSKEAKLAKALDRIEPLFHIYNENGKEIMRLQQTTREQSWNHKEPYVKDYPFIFRFFNVIEENMEKEGFFH